MELVHLSGLSHSAETTVVESITASAVGSGGVDVLSTPSLILLFEQAARDAVQHALPDGYTTVGIRVNIEHVSATPLGEHVTAEATVTAVEGRKITFKVSAVDEHGTIGRGTHVRAVINLDSFMKKLSDRNK